MTIPPTFLVVEKYTGNNAARDFSFSFWAFDSDDIVVTQADRSGEESILKLNTDYSVLFNLNNLGGIVRLNTALPTGFGLAVSRSTPINQEMDLVNQGAFYAEDHETAFDKLTAICQELKEVLGRCLKVPVTSDKTPEQLLKEIFEAAQDAIDSAKSAAKDAIRSEDAADRAEAGAQRVEDILTRYESGVICKSFKASDSRWKQVSTAFGTKYRLVLDIGSTALIGVYSGTTSNAEKVITGVLLSGENVTIEVPEPFTGFLFTAMLTKKVADYVFVKGFLREYWVLTGMEYVLTIPASEHKCGKTPTIMELVKIANGKRELFYAYDAIDADGNVTISSTEPFDGEIVLDGGYLKEAI